MMEHICEALKDKVRCANCGTVYQLIKVDDAEWYLEAYADDTIRNCHPLEIGKSDLADMVNREGQFIDFGLDYLPEFIEEIRIMGWTCNIRLKPMSQEDRSRLLLVQDFWLVQQSLLGHELAKEALYLKYAPYVRKTAYIVGSRINLNQWDLEDLQQDVWLRAFWYLRSYRGEYPFRFWLSGILRHEFCKIYGKRKKENPFDEEKLTELLQNTERTDELERCKSRLNAQSILLMLDEREREIVVDHLFLQKSLLKLSLEHNLSYYRMRVIYHKALEKMRNCILNDS